MRSIMCQTTNRRPVMTDSSIDRKRLPIADTNDDEPKSNILVVDDRPNNLLAMEAILSGLGQNVRKARSGEEALRFLLDEDFAVILMDVQMPGLDGFDTAKLI